MKKVNFAFGTLFLVMTTLFLIYIVRRVVHGEGCSTGSVLTTIFAFSMSALYFYLGVRIGKRQKERFAKLVDLYDVLVGLHEEIKSTNNPQDKLPMHMFMVGVHDFGMEAFDIASGDYPPEMKHEAETMVDNLMRLVAELNRDSLDT